MLRLSDPVGTVPTAGRCAYLGDRPPWEQLVGEVIGLVLLGVWRCAGRPMVLLGEPWRGAVRGRRPLASRDFTWRGSEREAPPAGAAWSYHVAAAVARVLQVVVQQLGGAVLEGLGQSAQQHGELRCVELKQGDQHHLGRLEGHGGEEGERLRRRRRRWLPQKVSCWLQESLNHTGQTHWRPEGGLSLTSLLTKLNS